MEGAGVFLIAFEVLAEQGGEFLQREPGAFLAVFGSLDDAHEHLAQAVEPLVLQVVLHELSLLLLGEPVAFALGDLLLQLCIELVVVDGCLEVDVAVDGYADEAA